MFDLTAATALADTFRAVRGPIVVDGAAVERVGAAGLQLLLSARATAAEAGHRLTIITPSAALQAAARTAGAGFLLAADV